MSLLLGRAVWLLAAIGAPAVAVPMPEALSPQAAFDRGVAYDLGKFGAPDARTALVWYRRAAAAEMPAAQLNVAVMCDSGRGTAADPVQAGIWYAAAAAHGDARAAFDMGQLYDDGAGVPRNDEAARAWFALAAARGVHAAAHRHVEPSNVVGSALLAATALRPADDALAPQGDTVSFVWSAPQQPRQEQPVATYVQVVRREGSGQRMVYSGFATVTAVAVALPPGQGTYAWRTLTVSATGGHYIASPWAHFTADIKVN